MASPMLTPDPDSRTSSVGRKRGFDQSPSSSEQNVKGANDSSDEETKHIPKRIRPNQEADGLSRSQIGTVASQKHVVTNEDSPVMVPSEPDERPGQSSGTRGHGSNPAVASTAPSFSWNKGIQSDIRTSFGTRASQALPILSPTMSTQEHDSKSAESSEPQPSPSPSSSLLLGVEDTPNTRQSTMSQPAANATRLDISNWRKEEQISKNVQDNIIQLPNAQNPIQTSPEIKSDQQKPRQVPGVALKYDLDGKVFRLPCVAKPERETNMPFPKSVKYGQAQFIRRFLELNHSSLDEISYTVVSGAYRTYIDLHYGHLPKVKTELAMENFTNNQTLESHYQKCRKELIERLVQMNKKKTIKDRDLGLIEDDIEVTEVTIDSGQNDNIGSITKGISEGIASGSSATLVGPWQPPDSMIWTERPNSAAQTSKHWGVDKSSKSNAWGLESVRVESAPADAEHLNFNAPLRSLNNAPRHSAVPEVSGNTTAVYHPQDLVQSFTELELQQRYYLANKESPFVPRCLTCAQPGHKSSGCPSLSCGTCGLRSVHFTDACPQTQRCTKCREPGHNEKDCTEKLALSASEGLSCDICASRNHTKQDCHMIWRSFRPESVSHLKQVRDIPISCSYCGSHSHLGADCGLRQTPSQTEDYTWSMKNWNQYSDSRSEHRAISAANNYSLPDTKTERHFIIKGRAAHDRVRNTDEDDEDDVSFLSQRVTRVPRPVWRGKKQINFDKDRAANYASVQPLNFAPPTSYSRNDLPTGGQGTHGGSMPLVSNGGIHNGYQPRDDSARHRRERSFSPPPRYQQDNHQPRPGSDHYEPRDKSEGYRHELYDYSTYSARAGADGVGPRQGTYSNPIEVDGIIPRQSAADGRGRRGRRGGRRGRDGGKRGSKTPLPDSRGQH